MPTGDTSWMPGWSTRAGRSLFRWESAGWRSVTTPAHTTPATMPVRTRAARSGAARYATDAYTARCITGLGTCERDRLIRACRGFASSDIDARYGMAKCTWTSWAIRIESFASEPSSRRTAGPQVVDAFGILPGRAPIAPAARHGCYAGALDDARFHPSMSSRNPLPSRMSAMRVSPASRSMTSGPL